MSIRPGWFYHADEEPHSLQRLWNTYLNTVGANCCFHLNVPPTSEGLIDPRDEKRLHELGEKIRKSFIKNIAEDAEFTTVNESDYQADFDLNFDTSKEFNCIILQEEIEKGQRIENFSLYKKDDFGNYRTQFFEGTCVGNKKICIFDTEKSNHIRISVTSARGKVNLRKPMVYKIDE